MMITQSVTLELSSLTNFSYVHEHGHKDVVNETEGGAVCEEGIPHLQDAGQGEFPTKQQTNPSTA